MTNKAQEELQALLDMQDDAQQSQANLAKIESSRHDFVAQSSGGSAKFDMAQALPFIVGASWIMGPVGGLLVGLAQGILGKRARQNALDAYNDEMGTLEATQDIFHDEISRQALLASSPEDIAQLSAIQTQMDAAVEMMSSASPELQQQGGDLLSDASVRLNEYTVRQETQQIAADAYDAQLQRDLDKEDLANYKTAIAAFKAESTRYEDMMQATDIALDALANGTPADLWAAGILVNKALDPTGIVRKSESDAIGEIGSYWEQANVFMERARSGQTLLPNQRKELSALIYSMRETNTKFQLAREARYADQNEDMKMPAEYRNNFRLVTSVPAAATGDMKNVATLPSEDIDKAARDAIYPYTDQGIANNLKYTLGNFKNWAQGEDPEGRAEAERKRQLEQVGR